MVYGEGWKRAAISSARLGRVREAAPVTTCDQQRCGNPKGHLAAPCSGWHPSVDAAMTPRSIVLLTRKRAGGLVRDTTAHVRRRNDPGGREGDSPIGAGAIRGVAVFERRAWASSASGRVAGAVVP